MSGGSAECGSIPEFDGTGAASNPSLSCRVRIDLAQLANTVGVVGKVFHSDRGLGSRQPDGAHQGAALIIDLRAEHMLHPGVGL